MPDNDLPLPHNSLPQGFRTFVMGANFLPVPLGGRLAEAEVMARKWPKGRQPYLEPVTDGGPSVALRKKLQVAFKLLESIRFGGGNLSRELCNPPSSPLNLRGEQRGDTNLFFFCSYKDKLGYLPPWLADDGDPRTKDDADFRRQISSMVEERKARLERSGLVPDTLEYNREMVAGLLSDLGGLEGKDGNPIRYSQEERYFAYDGVDAYKNGVAACHGFSFNLAAMLALAGIPFEFIRISGRIIRDERGRTVEVKKMLHIGLAVYLGPRNADGLVAVDPSLGTFLEEEKQQWYPITRLEMTVYHLRNVAFQTPQGSLGKREFHKWKEGLLRQALTLAPDNFEVLLAVWEFFVETMKDPTRGEFYRRKAARTNPSLKPFWRY